jgi:hypothetical protein
MLLSFDAVALLNVVPRTEKLDIRGRERTAALRKR